jgi:hypothetical protein
MDMRRIALAALGALSLGAAVTDTTSARANGYGYDDYDAPATVVTRRTIVERPVVVRPRPVVREVIVERPVVYRPHPVVREVVVERPVVYRPRREVVVERDGFYEPRRFGPRPVGFGYGGFYPY